MKKGELSLRQILVLTVTGLLAPSIDLLPGLLTRTAGRTAWLTPVLMLPVILLWTAMLGRLFREEGSGLFVVLRQRPGKVVGWLLTLLYIMWGIWLLAEQVGRSARRMSAVYGGRGGELMAVLVLLLALWMVCGKGGALCRAGELFWLAAAVTVAAVVLLALPQMKWKYLLPGWEEWTGQPRSWLEYLNVWSTAVFGAALLPRAARERGMVKKAVGWSAVSCLGAAALIGVVVGQMGAGLASKLPQPFLIMVQGLSLEGAVSRLEAPVAALWLLADFCRAGLLLAVLREAGGEKGGNWLALIGGGLAVAGSFLLPEMEKGVPGGILPGILIPLGLWLLSLRKRKHESGSTSCGE